MTQYTGTFSSYDAIGVREDLSDMIWNIDPTETPIVSSIARVAATNRKHEWQTDVLASAVANNINIEGDDAPNGDSITPTVRIFNYTQILDKVVVITTSEEEMKKAGRGSEMDYQVANRLLELRRDLEMSVTANVAKVIGTDTVARRMGGLGAWVGTNDVFASGSTGGSPASPVGADGSAARTDASTTAAFNETDFKTALALCWTAGGNPNLVTLSATNKQIFSNFSGGATRFYRAESRELVATVDVYASDFGGLTIVPNRFQRSRDVWILDPNLLAIAELHGVRQQDLAITGLARKKQIFHECTLEVRNEKGLAMVADTTG